MPRMSEGQKHIQFILDADVKEQIETQAQAEGISVSAFMRKVTQEYFRQNHKRVDMSKGIRHRNPNNPAA